MEGVDIMQRTFISDADSVASSLGIERSQEWEDHVRKVHLEINQPGYNQACCAVCQGDVQLQVHHIIPFHLCHLVYRGDLELDERNLMTLCEVREQNHHLLLGHLSDWEIYNPAGREGIKEAFPGQAADSLTEVAIQKAQIWEQWFNNPHKPVRWSDMQPEDRIKLRQFLDTYLPYIETPDFPASAYPYAFTTEDAAAEKGDPEKIATTYGTETRWQQFQQQASKATSGSAI
jgi:hypothetical protein